ncbi:hypothetical protein [Pontibacter cellulosilyticus]|uniref:DUF2892 domain-containing protein n=1 Tax=Pontibacter cellulosilyticus TaxID=1720253 RepID=A0A923SK48_9BACT|nr:hypothetical protein [Pontibacter cellulosilyticus]MBC5994372.1 hypothetical protein [Pontibacter cellulosilyticus]
MNKYEGRVRESSTDTANQKIDRQTLENIERYGYDGPDTIDQRLKELEKEWDIERVLEVNASTLALSGIILGATKDKRWFILPGIVTSFLLQHGLQGWCPPLPILRKLGFRTRKEIEEERVSLKALRGDFNRVLGATTPAGVLNVVRD